MQILMSVRREVMIVTGLRCVLGTHVSELVCVATQKVASSAPVGQGSKEMVISAQVCVQT